MQTNRPWPGGHEHKEEDVRRLIAAAAILAVVFILGCQDTKKVTELQGQVDKLNQQITEMQNVVVAKLTVERDSLAKLVADFQAKYPPAGTKPTGTKPPSGAKPPKPGMKPPTKQ
jgi:outer membrane murein-binding lipoprotein Lpp